MINSDTKKAVLARATLGHIPPVIQSSLLNKQTFRGVYNLKTESMFVFNVDGATFQRSLLLDAIKETICTGDTKVLIDDKRKTWTLSCDAEEGNPPNLILSTKEQQLELNDFFVFSEDISIRIQSLIKSSSRVNLPTSAQDGWRKILEDRVFNYDEFSSYISDIQNTPTHVKQKIQNSITIGQSSVSSFVPDSKRYYERLVGKYDGSSTISEYAINVAQKLFEQLSAWKPIEGFFLSLLLSSHSALTTEIMVSRLNSDELVDAFKYLVNYGDMLSRLGGIEIGFKNLPDYPETEPQLLQLISTIKNDSKNGNTSDFKLFSSLFVLVEGELARIRLLEKEPPFYRRLASLAQAALIHRQLVQCDLDRQEFIDWATNSRGQYYYMQSLADIRLEPRWIPDQVTAKHMQADYIGRILLAGKKYSTNLGEGELHEDVLGDGESSIIKQCMFPLPFLSGPLEGAEYEMTDLPTDVVHETRETLSNNVANAISLLHIANLSMIYKVTSSDTELVIKAIKESKYRIIDLEGKGQLISILNGLATVAAVSRNVELANVLRVLVRRYRLDQEYGFSINEAMRICLIASACNKDLMDWRMIIGEWLTELAFEEMVGDEANVFHSHLTALLHVVPELWITCARADAALNSLI